MDIVINIIKKIFTNQYLLLIILGILGCFEIAPIKFNPISSILKWIGKKVNGEVLSRVDKLEKEIGKIQYDNMMSNAINCRIRILHFGDELRQGVNHSKEAFEQILEDIDIYQNYCKKHPEFKNNRTVLTVKKILEVYDECMEKNNFL